MLVIKSVGGRISWMSCWFVGNVESGKQTMMASLDIKSESDKEEDMLTEWRLSCVVYCWLRLTQQSLNGPL